MAGLLMAGRPKWRIVGGSISAFLLGFTSAFKRFTVISMIKRAGDPR